MDALGINIGYLVMQILGITILLLIMRGLVYSPMLRLLEERRARIAKGLEDARQAAISRDNADAQAKKILEEARQEAAKLRQEAVAQVEETRKGILAQAEDEAKQIVENARGDAESERNQILSELRSQVAAIAIAAANKIVGDSLDEKRQHALLEEFFAKVPESVAGLSGDHAEVTSALPLTDQEKASVQSTVKAERIDYKVNPGILGGLVIRVGDQVVDNSVAGQMSAMRAAIK